MRPRRLRNRPRPVGTGIGWIEGNECGMDSRAARSPLGSSRRPSSGLGRPLARLICILARFRPHPHGNPPRHMHLAKAIGRHISGSHSCRVLASLVSRDRLRPSWAACFETMARTPAPHHANNSARRGVSPTTAVPHRSRPPVAQNHHFLAPPPANQGMGSRPGQTTMPSISPFTTQCEP